MKNKISKGIILSLAVLATASVAFKPALVSRSKSFSGEQLFKGIYFHNGEVADLIPELRNQRKSVELSKVKNLAFQDKLIQGLLKEDAQFFFKFKSSIISGDPIRVEEGLNSSNEKIAKLLMAISSKKSLGQEAENTPQSNVDLYSYAFIMPPPPPAIDKGIWNTLANNTKSLETESLINSIAQSLTE